MLPDAVEVAISRGRVSGQDNGQPRLTGRIAPLLG